MTTKVCTSCKEELPATLEFFYAEKNTRLGLRSRCKPCHSASTVRTRNKEKARQRLQEWRKANPDKVKAQNLRAAENPRRQQYLKNYAISNKEQVNARRNKWLQRTGKGVQYVQNRRARKAVNGGTVTATDWREVLEFYGTACLAPNCSSTEVEMDHVVSLANGGPHCKCNLQPLCKHHNATKFTETIDYRHSTLWCATHHSAVRLDTP